MVTASARIAERSINSGDESILPLALFIMRFRSLQILMLNLKCQVLLVFIAGNIQAVCLQSFCKHRFNQYTGAGSRNLKS